MNAISIPWDPTPIPASPPSKKRRTYSSHSSSSSIQDTQQVVTMASLMLAPGQQHHQPQIDLKYLDQSFANSKSFTFTSQPPHFHQPGTSRSRQSSARTTSSCSSDRDCKPTLASLQSSVSPANSTAASTPPSSVSPLSPTSPTSSSSSDHDSFSHWNALGAMFSTGATFGFGSGGMEEARGAECLACGYRYEDLGVLAEHQRMEHGLVDVVF